MPIAMAAQNSAKPAVKAPSDDSPSKWDIFGGYSFLSPKGTIQTPLLNASGTLVNTPVNYEAITGGGIFSIARYFNKYTGVEAIGDVHLQNEASNSSTPGVWPGPRDDFSGGSLGMIFRFPTADITPFAHALVGGERVGGPHWQADRWGAVLTVGGGLDYSTPLFNHHLGIRLFLADYQYTHEDYGQQQQGGRANVNIARLSTGIVYHIGSIAPPPPVTLACSASPTSVFPGEPVTVTSTAGDLDPKMNAIYSFSGAGVTSNGATATVATGALAAGSYTVNCGVKEGKPGKEGLKPGESADATASFTVKAFEPPTISCSASPSNLKPGDPSTVTAVGVSPQNRPLTYSYSSTGGTISGSGTTANFSSTGAPTGVVGITCTVSDDKNQTATANTSVTITAPYVAPAPHTSSLCSISFATDKKRPTRVDNEAKACLDEVALDLQRQSDAKAVVVGESTADEKAPPKKTRGRKAPVAQDIAAERAVNTKEYLVTDKGIDASRVMVMTGTTDGQTVEDYLVPAGATFSSDISGTSPVDENSVKPEVRKPLPERHPKKKAAAQ